jgi:hypothetical protein
MSAKSVFTLITVVVLAVVFQASVAEARLFARSTGYRYPVWNSPAHLHSNAPARPAARGWQTPRYPASGRTAVVLPERLSDYGHWPPYYR